MTPKLFLASGKMATFQFKNNSEKHDASKSVSIKKLVKTQNQSFEKVDLLDGEKIPLYVASSLLIKLSTNEAKIRSLMMKL